MQIYWHCFVKYLIKFFYYLIFIWLSLAFPKRISNPRESRKISLIFKTQCAKKNRRNIYMFIYIFCVYYTHFMSHHIWTIKNCILSLKQVQIWTVFFFRSLSLSLLVFSFRVLCNVIALKKNAVGTVWVQRTETNIEKKINEMRQNTIWLWNL